LGSIHTHLGVQEGGATVAGHHKVASEGTEGALGVQALQAEQEGHALTTWELQRKTIQGYDPLKDIATQGKLGLHDTNTTKQSPPASGERRPGSA